MLYHLVHGTNLPVLVFIGVQFFYRFCWKYVTKMAGRGRGGRNIQYTAQEVPAFIRRFKEKVGYKEDPGVEAKVCFHCNSVILANFYSFWYYRSLVLYRFERHVNNINTACLCSFRTRTTLRRNTVVMATKTTLMTKNLRLWFYDPGIWRQRRLKWRWHSVVSRHLCLLVSSIIMKGWEIFLCKCLMTNHGCLHQLVIS